MYTRIITAASKKLKKTNPRVKKLSKPKSKNVLKRKPSNTIKPSKKPGKSRNKSVNKQYKIKRTNPNWPRQDESLSTFQDLLEEGYNRATFVAYSGACNFCKKLNGKTWNLSRFISTTKYDASIFSHAHVNAASKIKVWDVNNELDSVYVDYIGEIFDYA